MKTDPIDDALLDLEDAIKAFKAAPNPGTLDDVYRATTSIESACRDRQEQGVMPAG